MTRVAITVDDEIHRRAKAMASLRGQKLYEWIEAAMLEVVVRQEAEADRRRGGRA